MTGATVHTGTEWLVGLGRANLTVTPYTVMRILHMERVARLNHQTLTRSICRGSTTEVAQSVRLGLSASGNVPVLLYPTHLFVLPGPPSLVVPWASLLLNPPSLWNPCCGFAPAAQLRAAFTSFRE